MLIGLAGTHSANDGDEKWMRPTMMAKTIAINQ